MLQLQAREEMLHPSSPHHGLTRSPKGTREGGPLVSAGVSSPPQGQGPSSDPPLQGGQDRPMALTSSQVLQGFTPHGPGPTCWSSQARLDLGVQLGAQPPADSPVLGRRALRDVTADKPIWHGPYISPLSLYCPASSVFASVGQTTAVTSAARHAEGNTPTPLPPPARFPLAAASWVCGSRTKLSKPHSAIPLPVMDTARTDGQTDRPTSRKVSDRETCSTGKANSLPSGAALPTGAVMQPRVSRQQSALKRQQAATHL